MRIFKIFRGKNYSLKKHVAFSYAIGLVGFFYQLHQIFILQQNEGIAFRTAKGFLIAAAAGFCLYILLRLFPYPFIRIHFYKLLSITAYIFLAGLTFYIAYVTYSNSRYLFDIGLLWDGIKFFIGYLLSSFLLTFLFKHRSNFAFAKASMILFLGASLFIFVKVNLLTGLFISCSYFLFLMCLGHFIIDGIRKIFKFRINAGMEAVILAFIFGILCNYLIWYCLGHLALLYPATAVSVVVPVLSVGIFFYGKAFKRFLAQLFSEWSMVRSLDLPSAILLNITLYCIILIFAVIGIKVPGDVDSQVLMYGATLYKFAALHRIAFLPFTFNWPLIFQPLLFEITGLPVYLIGGISAWRLFNFMCFFSFVPILVFLRRSYNLSFRTIIIVLFLYVSSSFTFNMAYSDKPEVLAFPAFLSLLSIGLLMLKETKSWYWLAFAGLASIVYSTKLVLIFGCLIVALLLCASLVINRPRLSLSGNKKILFISLGLFALICFIHASQNMVLRGNPFHPFGSRIFMASNQYPEEVQYLKTPEYYYRRTIPTTMPSLVSGINLDSDWGIYRPLIKAKYPSGHATYWHIRYTINAVTILVFVALPVLLLLNSGVLYLFCSLVAMLSFYIWFGWIGDGLRYSTFFPAVALLTAAYLGQNSLPNEFFDTCWRYLIYIILILSVPFAIASTFVKKEPAEVFDYIFSGKKAPESIRSHQHPVTSYLNDDKKRKPVLLVSELRILQYGCFQPNFLFQPYFSSQTINMVYISKIKPTHLLTSEYLDKSILIKKYPTLRTYLTLEKQFFSKSGTLKLYRFQPDVPWENFFTEFSQRENFHRNWFVISNIFRTGTYPLSIDRFRQFIWSERISLEIHLFFDLFGAVRYVSNYAESGVIQLRKAAKRPSLRHANSISTGRPRSRQIATAE